jgi:hypothetical protein
VQAYVVLAHQHLWLCCDRTCSPITCCGDSRSLVLPWPSWPFWFLQGGPAGQQATCVCWCEAVLLRRASWALQGPRAGCCSAHLLCCCKTKAPTPSAVGCNGQQSGCCCCCCGGGFCLWLLVLLLLLAKACRGSPAKSVQLARVCTHQRVRVSTSNLQHSQVVDNTS